MAHFQKKIIRVATTLMVALSLVASAAAGQRFQTKPLADSVPSGLQNAKVLGSTSPSTILSLAIGLEPRFPAELEAFCDSVSDPSSPNYRHFITPVIVGENFGASFTDVENVVSYLKSKGIKVTLVAENRMAILAQATVAQAQAAFGTRIKDYRGPDVDGTVISFHANATPVLLPDNIVNVVQCVTGLNDFGQPHPRTTLTPGLARTLYSTAPSYGYGFQGQGRRIAYSNWDGYRISDAALFISAYGLPVPAGGATSNIHIVSVQGSNAGGVAHGEGDLDLQMELSSAPLADIYIYDSTTYNDLLTLTREANDNIADIISESYGFDTSQVNVSTGTSCHNEHLTMTADGQTFLVASGDRGTADMVQDPYPDPDPDITNVGGTIATVNGSGVRTSETSWSGSGGGWCTFGYTFNTLPSWQHGTGVLTGINNRLVPDIAMHSQSGNNSAFFIYYQGGLTTIAGTSCASPWCASGLATLEQRLASALGGSGRLGRINDMIYSENGRSDVWFDIVSGSGNGTLPNGSQGVVTAGWDVVTGWGAPNFDAWYIALVQQIVNPTGFSLFRGIQLSGDVNSLLSVDQNYLGVRPGLTLSAAEAPIQIIVNGTSPYASASDLRIDLVGHVDSPGMSQTIELYDWVAGGYVSVDTRAATTSDSTVEVVASNPSRFVQSGTRGVRARVSFKPVGPTTHWPVNAFVDETIWKIMP